MSEPFLPPTSLSLLLAMLCFGLLAAILLLSHAAQVPQAMTECATDFCPDKEATEGSMAETWKGMPDGYIPFIFTRDTSLHTPLAWLRKISSSSNEHSRWKCLADKVNGFLKFSFCQKEKHVVILPTATTNVYPFLLVVPGCSLVELKGYTGSTMRLSKWLGPFAFLRCSPQAQHLVTVSYNDLSSLNPASQHHANWETIR